MLFLYFSILFREIHVVKMDNLSMTFNRSHAQKGAAATMQQPLNGFDQTVSILMVLVLPPPRETGPPVMMTLEPFASFRDS